MLAVEETTGETRKAILEKSSRQAEEFRKHTDNPYRQMVENTYRLNHKHQTLDYVLKKKEEYSRLDRVQMSLKDALALLNEVIDESDPDTHVSQINHLIQSAEALRKLYPEEEYDWLHLTALLHDCGKILAHPKFANEPMWAVVGDTFPVGCKFSEKLVFPEFFPENPDFHNPLYNTENGIYTEGCGLDNVHMSWGHDEYMYYVAVQNGTTLPREGLYIIRYHSFYALHKEEEYQNLLNEEDRRMIPWLKTFSQFDLYTKSHELPNIEKVMPYYEGLIAKYFPNELLRW